MPTGLKNAPAVHPDIIGTNIVNGGNISVLGCFFHTDDILAEQGITIEITEMVYDTSLDDAITTESVASREQRMRVSFLL